VAVKKYQLRKRGRLHKEAEKNPCLPDSPWGIKLCNGPYSISMISTKRSVDVLFHEKNSNKYHLFSTVQKLKELKKKRKMSQSDLASFLALRDPTIKH